VLGNYNITYNTANFSITKKAASVTPNPAGKVYGSPDPILTGTLSGFLAADSVTATYSRTAGETVAGSPYTISATLAPAGVLGNYNITYNTATFTITPREGRVAYIGQTAFVTSGSSSTNAQVTLTASVSDPDGSVSAADISTSTVTFKDLLTNTVIASNVKVSLVSNTDKLTGTANTVLTLSTGQYGAQEYLIEVTLNGNYRNCQQTGPVPNSTCPATPTVDTTSTQYQAAHPVILVTIPATVNSTQGVSAFAALSPAGTYGDPATQASYAIGMKYNKGGSNPQGQIQLILKRADGIYYIKSNSITSLAFSTPVGTQPPKNVTIYTKASIYRVNPSGGTTSIEGNVTLRFDGHEGCAASPNCSGSSDDSIGFTVLSTKDSSLFYSNNWVYDPAKAAFATVMQAISGFAGIAIN
jgi:hypothetical protein